MRIIFGLGNPGFRYKNTRHNIGYMTVEAIAKDKRITFKRYPALSAQLAQFKIEDEEVVLVKPRIFMNNSGICAKKVLEKYKCLASDILIVYDDIDLPLGVLRFRQRGSFGGHRGIASILSSLGTDAFDRLKIGIGRPAAKEVSDYVLCGFSRKEKKALGEVIERAAAAVTDWAGCGSHYVMSKYNQRSQ